MSLSTGHVWKVKLLGWAGKRALVDESQPMRCKLCGKTPLQGGMKCGGKGKEE